MSVHAAVLAAETSTAQSFLLPALMILLLVGLFVMNSRSRKKAAASQAKMRSNLDIGARVQMISGMKGTVAFVDGDDVGVEIADGVVATFNGRAVAEVLAPADTFGNGSDVSAPDDVSGLVEEPERPGPDGWSSGDKPSER